ncbi:hypothetical protein VB602_21745 [Vibrio parahaemolyticus]|uniref:hypothetical protein n=1 Tax=Vibrio parahaemolyticus TaxID=670 RepID=UPI002B205503|nr:hypothetical protein [Vibrio parahaemolyticus]MEA5238886.1 hypothetical protein [Vibrio parahaemolyticus]
MEELRYLAKIYYQNTVRFSYFGFSGVMCLTIALILFLLGAYLNFRFKFESISVFIVMVAGLLIAQARSIYNRNLVSHLSNVTLLNSDNVDHHKAVYLYTLVSHIGDSLFDAMKNFKEVRETARSEHGFSTQSEWSRFLSFIYNPDSKNRILSLVIYMISLIALIIVPRTEGSSNLYNIVSQLSLNDVWGYLILCIFWVVLAYVIVGLPIIYLYQFIIIPILLKTSSVDALSRFFISELAKYAYLDRRVERSC